MYWYGNNNYVEDNVHVYRQDSCLGISGALMGQMKSWKELAFIRAGVANLRPIEGLNTAHETFSRKKL